MRIHRKAVLFPPVGLFTGLCDVCSDVKQGSAAQSLLYILFSLSLCPSEKLLWATVRTIWGASTPQEAIGGRT